MEQKVNLYEMALPQLKQLRDDIDREMESRVRQPGVQVKPAAVVVHKSGHTLAEIKDDLCRFGKLNWCREIPYGGVMAEYADERDAADAIRELRAEQKYCINPCDANSSNPLGLE